VLCELERFLVDADAGIRRFLREIGPEVQPDYANGSERLAAVDADLRILRGGERKRKAGR
jgi:hypothetical protein